MPSQVTLCRSPAKDAIATFSQNELVRLPVISPEQAVEKFNLWHRRDQTEFGVYVSIIFNSKTEELQSIQFNETDR
ncbi:DUF3889 domain-containing protein [Cohnella zeiphila]